MNFNNQDEEEENPFPDDGSYQDKNEVKIPEIIAIKKYGKIPIKIYGLNRFHLSVEAGAISCSIPCIDSPNGLEDGISRAMQICRHRAANYKGSLEDLFVLVYSKASKKSIEKQLGKYSNLEKSIVDNHKAK